MYRLYMYMCVWLCRNTRMNVNVRTCIYIYLYMYGVCLQRDGSDDRLQLYDK